jgi:hypothetical protein
MYNSNDPFISSLLIVDKLIKYKHIADDLQLKYKRDYLDTFFFISTSDPIVFLQQLCTRFSEFHSLFYEHSTNAQQLFKCDPTIKFKLLSLLSMLSNNTLHFYILNHNSFSTDIRDFFNLCLSDFAHNLHNLLSLLYITNNNDNKKLVRLKKLHNALFDKIKKTIHSRSFT